MLFNTQCKSEVKEIHKVEEFIVDYRINQFDYYNNNLKSIYYSCYSLKNVIEVNNFMQLKGIKEDAFETIERQRRYITFTAIVKMSSIFEYTRKVYEKEIPKKDYLKNLSKKYKEKSDSLMLLIEFRNAIHNNGKWVSQKGDENLTYWLREGEQELKSGDVFVYDHWKLYRIFKDCIELNKLMALDNEPLKIRQTSIKVNGQRLSVMKTNLTPGFLDSLTFNEEDGKL